MVWQPIRVDDARPHATPRTVLDPTWRMGAGVDILYDPGLLTPGSMPKTDSGTGPPAVSSRGSRGLHGAGVRVAAGAGRTPGAAGGTRIPIVMLRFQTQGRKRRATDGDTLIYAAAQAVEAALMRDTPVRMQGMVCTPDEQARRIRKRARLSRSPAPSRWS